VAESLEKKTTDQETLLLDYMQQLEKDRGDRRMAHLHLSCLKPSDSSEEIIRTAVSIFEPMASSSDARIFALKNLDLYLFFVNSAYDLVKTNVEEVRELFSDDPLISEEDNSKQKFVTWYDIEQDFDLILQSIQNLAQTEHKKKTKEGGRKDARAALKAKQKIGYPLTPRVLAKVETALARADLSSLVRRQFICRVDTQMVPEKLFSELFISIKDLRETILPDVNLASNRWLFQHLTKTLDKRMLAMLGKSDVIPYSGDLSFNMNVTTVLSPEFITFNEKISAGRRGSLIIEFQKEDIFSDLGAFIFARDFAQNKGYKICIDGLTLETFPILDRKSLGADLVKLIWHPDLTNKGEELNEKIRTMVKFGGGDPIVMCRCDGRDAIDFGRSVGIEIFQGRHVETLIVENNRRLELDKMKNKAESEEKEDDKSDPGARGRQAAGNPGKK